MSDVVMCPTCEVRELELIEHVLPKAPWVKTFRTAQGSINKTMSGSGGFVVGRCTECEGVETRPIPVGDDFDPGPEVRRLTQ